MQLIVYGASDDLIEIEGDFCEEFNALDTPRALVLSDGTMLEIMYEGDWKIRVNEVGDGTSVSVTPPVGGEYSDRACISSEQDFEWVMCGSYKRIPCS